MLIIKLKKPSPRIIADIVARLRRGAVIVFPTETAYGMGCDATSVSAVREIYHIKGRPGVKALPMIVADARMAKKFFKLGTRDSELITRYWPGPLSIVFPAKKTIARAALLRSTAVVRMSSHATAAALATALGRPLIATSANISGAPLCYSIPAFLRQARSMQEKPDIVIDGGAIPKRKPSTIVRVKPDGGIEVLRVGSIKIQDSKFKTQNP